LIFNTITQNTADTGLKKKHNTVEKQFLNLVSISKTRILG